MLRIGSLGLVEKQGASGDEFLDLASSAAKKLDDKKGYDLQTLVQFAREAGTWPGAENRASQIRETLRQALVEAGVQL